MPKSSSKRIRVYGQMRQTIEPNLIVQALILLGRDLHRARTNKAPEDQSDSEEQPDSPAPPRDASP